MVGGNANGSEAYQKRLARQRLKREKAAASNGRALRTYTRRVVEENTALVTTAVHERADHLEASVTAAVHERCDQLEASVNVVNTGVAAPQQWFGEPLSADDPTDVQNTKLEAQIQTMRGGASH